MRDRTRNVSKHKFKLSWKSEEAVQWREKDGRVWTGIPDGEKLAETNDKI